ncbi:hypothetical protein FKB34_13480 [Glycocaulis profundi]|nr:hypothetical protein FKB34_13480 [Glycocaulis profundi]
MQHERFPMMYTIIMAILIFASSSFPDRSDVSVISHCHFYGFPSSYEHHSMNPDLILTASWDDDDVLYDLFGGWAQGVNVKVHEILHGDITHQNLFIVLMREQLDDVDERLDELQDQLQERNEPIEQIDKTYLYMLARGYAFYMIDGESYVGGRNCSLVVGLERDSEYIMSFRDGRLIGLYPRALY